MRILVIGSGGREHALVWKISQSPRLNKLFCAPGNAGTMGIAKNVEIGDSDIKGLADFATQEKIDLTVVGPELPLTLGIVDEFEERGLEIFGPRKSTAELEGSKVFAKQFMERNKIPTAMSRIAESPEEAKEILNTGEFLYPLVIKADGLAAGKGAIICEDLDKAKEVVNLIMVKKKFGKAGRKVLVEEFLRGEEMSFIVLSDGNNVVPLVTTMDHKAAFEGDKGPNTGGMGAISPSPYIDDELFSEITESIVLPTVTRMFEEGRKYKGVLYVGLMLTEEGPKVLEYNCRFGDPETQPQMLRMESDLVDVLLSIVREEVSEQEIKWSPKASACVILASGGYPLEHEKGKRIEGLEETSKIPGITLFHAGTKYQEETYYTNGGRVLGVCASEESLSETLDRIYNAIPGISFDGMFYRRDIGSVKEDKR
ncbi:MAG: phosphoribosylamine--glycine ligase [Candidatus Aminicenantes bacterium]|nr:phosphoribosylamine--glycine ligase [Candidatus Aminicenantes bacterium]MBL7083079.1 phosphoribosylamine--glycine ligase [Candidatus Aminicenantes bacterium]